MEIFEEPLGDERRRLLEQELRKDLHQFLLSMKEVDEWDTEWEIYSKIEDLYAYMRDKRGRDATEAYGVSHDKDELI